MARKPRDDQPKRVKKFTHAGALLSTRVRRAGERRGFAESRLLTQWAAIVGPDLAPIARPVKVSYAREGFGATLILACEGARAPEVQMQAETIRARVNACYGYNAISRVRLTQETAAGFAEAQAAFAGPAAPVEPAVHPEAARASEAATADIGDDGLRAALARLGQNVLTQKPTGKRQT